MSPLVEYVGRGDCGVLAFHMMEVFWELMVEGVVAPGMNAWNLDLPWYHVTAYSRAVPDDGGGHAHDEEAGATSTRSSRVSPP